MWNTLQRLISKYKLTKENKIGFEKLRNDYNDGNDDWWILYLLMCYSFNYQFRFNNAHQYNSSFGKNRSCFSSNMKKNLLKTKECLDSMDITFIASNFKDFDFSNFDSNNFIYCDPPYYHSTGNYNDGKRGFEGWNTTYEVLLRDLLTQLNKRNIKWAMSNNLITNTTLQQWAEDNEYNIHYLNNTYNNCNYQKKDKQSKDIEVLITNY